MSLLRDGRDHRLYQVILACGPEGCTDEELAVRTCVDRTVIAAGRRRLVKESLVVDSGLDRRNFTVWAATAQVPVLHTMTGLRGGGSKVVPA